MVSKFLFNGRISYQCRSRLPVVMSADASDQKGLKAFFMVLTNKKEIETQNAVVLFCLLFYIKHTLVIYIFV